MMTATEKYRQQVEAALSLLKFPEKPAELYEPVRYFLSLGGKRMRPVLLLMSNEMFSGNTTSAMPQALAMELFHNFTLIHDDIMDKAPLRRGLSTVHEKWNENAAILSGDVLFTKSFQLLAECEDHIFKPVHSLFCKTATEVCEGQQFDMEFENRNDVSIDEYIRMITLKTAVLLGCCLKTGALLARADKEDAEHIYEFGKNLGIAFQLKDDFLDAFGDSKKTGKQNGGDIRANKKTYLLLTAIESSDEKQKSAFANILRNADVSSDEKIKTVIGIYEETGAKEKSENEMKRYYEIALAHLQKINVPAEKKKPLASLAEQLMQRSQ